MSEWSAGNIGYARSCLWTTIEPLGRRFVQAFTSHPWKLGKLVSPGVSQDEKDRISHHYWNADECCLD
eukprot:7853047-Pyramimonas_sp.AAC.1